MKILASTDGSPCSRVAIEEACHRSWPPGSQLKVVTVVHAPLGYAVDAPVLMLPAFHLSMLDEDRARAPVRVAEAADQIRGAAPDLDVMTEVLEGKPEAAIVEAAERWGADVILMGVHDDGPIRHLLHHSVSKAVAARATCPVEVIHCQRSEGAEEPAPSLGQMTT